MSQTILITGGTGKFGRVFVSHFVKRGWNVIFTSTSRNRADSLIVEHQGEGELTGFVVDLTEENAAAMLIEKVHDAGHVVNHLVNNARSLNSLSTNRMGQTEREEFQQEYLLGVVVPYELSVALYNSQSDDLKTITNIGSQYGAVAANPDLYDVYPHQSPIQYGVAKAALMHLTKELAVRFSERQIRVNCIAYGGVKGRVDAEFEKRYSALSPSRRMLSEADLAGPLDSMIRDGNIAITGQTIMADGGWCLW
ncbi:SDR family oxidoreductase [Salinicola sp. DM10]|uniref:SDR family oxidoreductase n=1 Tax=Salinicola sp. DM10 TaxID=2815721 RepID=UPI001A8E7E34|nr:SDR family oxidoreductase [Salinicola sp. DM10]MCE3025996.1 SDR family oxidoreductase [Salinicola sp. DM10]